MIPSIQTGFFDEIVNRLGCVTNRLKLRDGEET
jgi:hypothetical protein